jgi:hypothetical protein
MTDRQGNGHSTNRVGGLSGHSNVFSLVMIVLLVEISAGKMSTKNSPAHTVGRIEAEPAAGAVGHKRSIA